MQTTPSGTEATALVEASDEKRVQMMYPERDCAGAGGRGHEVKLNHVGLEVGVLVDDVHLFVSVGAACLDAVRGAPEHRT